MALSKNDKKPVSISLKEAYSKIRKWYQANIEMVRRRNDEHGNRSAVLIEALPQTTMLTDLEIRAILGEVIYGNLEWAYHKDDGNFKMAAYAHGALETAGLSLHISNEEKNQLRNSTLWPHLILSQHWDLLEIIEEADREGKKKLDLSYNGIESLPTEIEKLKNLTKLDLCGNRLTSVPKELGQLTKLTILNLEINQLTSIPKELGRLTNLTKLYLHRNELASVPVELGKLENLTELNLSENKLTRIPAELGKLKKLTRLGMSGNPLESPTAEVVEKGTEAVLGYLRDELERRGKDYSNRGDETTGGAGEEREAEEGEGELRPYPDIAGFSMGPMTKRIISVGFSFARDADPAKGVLTTSWLLFALADLGWEGEAREDRRYNTARFFLDKVKEGEKESRNSYSKRIRQAGIEVQTKRKGRARLETSYVLQVLKTARKIAVDTTEDETIHVRHLLAGLILFKPEKGETGAQRRLREMGVDVGVMKQDYLAYLKQTFKQDKVEAWENIFGEKETSTKKSEVELMDVTIGASSISDQPSKKDALNFEPYTTAISNFLSNVETTPPLTISVEGEWGSGKSSFMLQLQNKLKELNKLDGSDMHIVEFSPWRHDKEEAVWAAFVLTFVDQLSKDLGWLKANIANFKLLWKRFNWQAGWPEVLKIIVKLWVYYICILVFVFIAFLATKIRFIQEMDFLVKLFLSIAGSGAGLGVLVVKGLKRAKEFVGNPFEHDLKKYVESPDYSGRIPFVERFHRDFESIVKVYAGDRRVYVFIDDLDRCEVPRAAELMKAINLMITENPPLIFIIGMDRQKVAAGLAVKDEKLIRYLRPEITGKKKDQIDGSFWRDGLRYGYDFIEKFIQLPFSIPRPTKSDIDDMMDDIAAKRSDETERKTAPGPESKILKEDEDLGSDEMFNVDLREKPKAKPQDKVSPTKRREEQKIEEKKKRRLELKLANDSDQVRRIVHMVAPFVDFNPRRIKQFINLFRLRAYIAYETQLLILPEEVGTATGVTLEQLGKIVAISLRWPLLLESLAQDEDLLKELSEFAEGEMDINSLTKEVAIHYSQDNQLMELIRFGCVKGKAEPYEWTKHTLSRAKIDKILQVSPRIRSMEKAPLEVKVSDTIGISDDVGVEVIEKESEEKKGAVIRKKKKVKKKAKKKAKKTKKKVKKRAE